ncbi:MAG TPA: class I SAM-dependent methyltransferase [Gemmatimonadaceae bacterium]|nr:class I SAM-dependent methyltransferase [Gemmatimonadaceae bacterium]
MPANRRLALDCATGSGQAARGLAEHFERVIATDASAAQISQATLQNGIEYRVAAAESSCLPDASVDLLTVAQGLHWLDQARFFAEARRVLKSDGAIAVWGYGDPVLDSPELESTLHHFNRVTIESYWLPERQLLLDGYTTIDFPFREIETPSFTLERSLTLPQLFGYVRSWSATARFVEKNGLDGLEKLADDLGRLWGDPEQSRLVRAPLFLRAGYPN